MELRQQGKTLMREKSQLLPDVAVFPQNEDFRNQLRTASRIPQIADQQCRFIRTTHKISQLRFSLFFCSAVIIIDFCKNNKYLFIMGSNA